MAPTARWEFFDSPELENSKIAKEMRQAKLSRNERFLLESLMEKVATGKGTAGLDFKMLRQEGLSELRFSGDRRIFRLLYSSERRDVLVLVGLSFVPKKGNKLPRQDFDTARARLESWRDSNPAPPIIINR